jgi:hypothetical protein
VQTYLLCQQRLYLSDFSLTDTPNSLSKTSIEEIDMASEDSEVRRINVQNGKTFSRDEQATQTSFEENVLHEHFEGVLREGPKRYLLGVSG